MPDTRRKAAAASVLWALAAAVVSFALFSVARESLVPYGCDFERARWRLTGDEPAYLLTAQAIASGDGEDVSRVRAAGTHTNFQHKIVLGPTQWTYDDYVRRCRVKFLFDRRKAWGDGAQIQHGAPLMPLFASPFALSPSQPRWKILCAQGVFASAVVAAIVLLSGGNGRKGGTAASAAATVAFFGSAPIVYYTAQIFPETLIGCFLALSLLLTRRDDAQSRAAGIVCLLLPLFGSSRIVGAVAAASVYHAVVAIRRRRISDLALIALGVVSYFGYHLWRWGNFFPPNTDQGSPITASLVPVGFLRYFFGNSVGLVFLCPVAWAGIVALAGLLRTPRIDPAVVPAALIAIVLPLSVGAFPAFRAGTCPAGRYQVATAFVLLIPVLLMLSREGAKPAWRRRVAWLLSTLGPVSLALGVWLAAHPGWWFERYHPVFKHPALQPHYGCLPDFEGPRGSLAAVLALWIAALVGWSLVPDICRAAKRCLKRKEASHG